ncbi:Trs65p ASCRUDRAFT_26876, partial [Ascoidea rubescens DSM 1968]
ASSRKIAFFDEFIAGYVVLANSHSAADNSNYFAAISELLLSLDLYVHPSSDNYNEPLDSKNRNYHIKNYQLASDKNDDDADDEKSLLISVWKFKLPIAYPKRKISLPEIQISISLTYQPNLLCNPHTPSIIDKENDDTLTKTDSIESRIRKNSLSESSKEIKKIPQTKNKVKNTTLSAKILLPVFPVLNMKLRCTKAAGKNDKLLATLDIEASKELNKINTSLDIFDIALDFPSGSINPLLPASLKTFPIDLKSNDAINFPYELTNSFINDNDSKKQIIVNIVSIPKSKKNHKYLANKIITKWSTLVDFAIIAPPTNSTLVKSSNISQQGVINYNSRIFSLSNLPNANNNLKPSHQSQISRLKSLRTASSSLNINIPRNSKSILNGLILSFNGTTNTHIGEVFKWKIQAINKSHNLLNLSLYIQPKDSANLLTLNLNSNLQNTLSKIKLQHHHNIYNNNMIIIPPNQLVKAFNQTKLSPRGIICLANDVKIGPLEPFQVFETEIHLIAIEKGIFSLQGVKIFDVNTGESFDCGRLLEVVVV